jgi:hypothetical protein
MTAKPKSSKPVGRPSSFNDKIAAEICDRLSEGEPLARICADDGMPDFSTVWRWEQSNEEFRNLSARAREVGTHYLADDCIRIADDAEIDPQNKRIMVDTRLRLIGKWNAKRYGERVTQEHTGEGGGPILYAELSDEELDSRIARLSAQA